MLTSLYSDRLVHDQIVLNNHMLYPMALRNFLHHMLMLFVIYLLTHLLYVFLILFIIMFPRSVIALTMELVINEYL